MPYYTHPWLGDTPLQWRTFLDTPPHEDEPENAAAFVIPVPYDSTTSFMSGARDGPAAIIEASRHLEDYDIELDRDISEVGIHTTPELQPRMDGPKSMIAAVRSVVSRTISHGKLPVLLGGEHSITIGGVQALTELHSDLSVLYIDAHADMRDSYMGTKWGHASVARRVSEVCPLALIGVRSISTEEKQFIEEQGIPMHLWDAGSPANLGNAIAVAADHLSDNIYISIDLDALDPSIMAGVGTPEPGGMLWHEILAILHAVSHRAKIVGFDLVELNPSQGPVSCAFTAAKLAYKLIGYATRH